MVKRDKRRDTKSEEPAEAGPGTSDAAAGDAEEAETPGHVDEVAAPRAREEGGPADELAALHDRYLRLAAEFDNFRRRTRRELGEAGEGARAGLASTLLEVMDDLRRVAETPIDGATRETLHEGIGLVARKFAKVLADGGVEQVNPAGERFDPKLHDALMMTPTADPEQDELVSHVVLVGYRLGDRLLRPARVTVFRHDEEDT